MKPLSTLCIAVALLLAGCSAPKGLLFSDRQWHVSDSYGQIIDRDTTYRMTFGNVLIPDPLTIISSADSAAKYPGMDRYMADILHEIGLDSAEILFFAPHMHTMFVIPKEPLRRLRPSSITSNIAEDKRYTMWINDGDVEDWNRTPTEMYTYTCFDTRKKRILVVDCYDYGDTPIAQIFVFQSDTKAIRKMNLPQIPQTIANPYLIHDLDRYKRDVEFWSSTIHGHRRLALANYKIGQEQKRGKR